MKYNKINNEYLKKKIISNFLQLVDKLKETNRQIINFLNIYYNVNNFIEFIYRKKIHFKVRKKILKS
jgi:hypothetical protein